MGKCFNQMREPYRNIIRSSRMPPLQKTGISQNSALLWWHLAYPLYLSTNRAIPVRINMPPKPWEEMGDSTQLEAILPTVILRIDPPTSYPQTYYLRESPTLHHCVLQQPK